MVLPLRLPAHTCHHLQHGSSGSSRHQQLNPRPQLCVPRIQQQQWSTFAAAASAQQQQPGPDVVPAGLEQQQQQQQQQFPPAEAGPIAAEESQAASSSSIGLPPGPMEPPDEEPKKLSNAARLSEELRSTSITIFGDDTELNWAVCQALSKKIGWFPVSTRKVLLGMNKAETLEELVAKEGRAAVVEQEAKMLKGMRGEVRCCFATIGDGAAADAALYRL